MKTYLKRRVRKLEGEIQPTVSTTSVVFIKCSMKARRRLRTNLASKLVPMTRDECIGTGRRNVEQALKAREARAKGHTIIKHMVLCV